MTRIGAQSRTVRRETAVAVRDGGRLRHIVVTLHAGFLLLRLKGRPEREAVSLGYESLYRLGIEQERESRRGKRPNTARAAETMRGWRP